MSYNYVVTAQKPTAVNACVTGKAGLLALLLLHCANLYYMRASNCAASRAGTTGPDGPAVAG